MKWTEIKKPILGLAPMADMTDSPFCRIMREIGGADVLFREMVSSEALVRNSEKTLKMTSFVEKERPTVQQIFGSNPEVMARAARIILDKYNPEGIDINMGCPVYKMTSNFNGAALMKDPELIGKIVKAVKTEIGDVPLSAKIRLGWSDPDQFKKIIPVLEENGVGLISIHGRTKDQGYSGKSDWNRIAEAKKMTNVPLLANGDINTPELVDEVLKITKADGVLIGRGALGNPWFFYQYKNPEKNITLEDRIKMIKKHAKLHIDFYGERGIVTFRKHLAWYFKVDKIGENIPKIKEFRSKLVRVESLVEMEEYLSILLHKK
ncbi:MAG: tRNA-dihydrouridine synthase [Candidatus Magasanikbacteria bacterium]|nr:tRNA-dihydrouridine synthase [Candidatus Magasanikbacteria bacterium]